MGYYRLSPYMIPFQEPGKTHRFTEGITFDDVLDLYIFDRHLRLLVLDALERIEVAIRASLTDVMSTTYSDPHWYTDPRHFQDNYRHRQLLEALREECANHLTRKPEHERDEVTYPSALEHYLTTYASPELPPSWVMVEMLTIGQLHRLYDNLGQRSDRTAVADSIGLNDPLLSSWLRCYVRVRNICAHHGRLWNVGLGVYPALPKDSSVAWLENGRTLLVGDRTKRLYPVLVSLQSVLATISPGSRWSHRLVALLADHPRVPLRGLGMFDGWSTDSFWATRLQH